MKKNKGFTLIELLAVIVILAIIALIAVPLILGVIEDANKGAAKATASNIIHAGELYIANTINPNADRSLYITDMADETLLEYKGTRPSAGFLTITDMGETEIGVIIGNYCVTKMFNEKEPVVVSKDDTSRPECQSLVGSVEPPNTCTY